MDTSQILRFLNLLFHHKKGTFGAVACDFLKTVKIKTHPIAIVSNSMPHTHPGEHWVCFYQQKKLSPMEFFCSYGKGIENYDASFKNFVQNLKVKKLIQRPRQLQSFSLNSDGCGQYCLYFISKRLEGYTRDSIYDSFSSSNLNANDKKVKSFVKSKNHLLSNTCKYKCKNLQCCNSFYNK